MKKPIYLDYMATTPVDPRVAEEMSHYLTMEGDFGNSASRSHAYGWRAEKAVARARQQLADLIHADPSEIIWTSGATESNNLAIKGAANFYQRNGKHIITCQSEHKAVLDPCKYLQTQGFDVTFLKPNHTGLIELSTFKDAIRDDTILISIMHVNNEIGVTQDIAAIGTLAHQHGILLHSDAAQSLAKLPLNVSELPVDLMSFSGHKIYGPKGIGALFVRRQPKRVRLEPLLHGGGHEMGLRSGTLPTHQIVGMGKACDIAATEMQTYRTRIAELATYFWEQLKQRVPDAQLNGDSGQCLAGNLNVSFAGVPGESLLPALKDIAVSSSSACSSASIEPSHVLTAIDVPRELAYSAVRLTIGRPTTKDEVDYALAHIVQVVRQLQSKS